MRDSVESIAEQLAETGWCLSDSFPGQALSSALLAHHQSLDPDAFHPAGIGRAARFVRNPRIRGDEIRWLDPAGSSPAVSDWFAAMEDLRLAVNRRLFLALFDYECHLARYPVGAGYRRHLDTFRDGPSRLLSTVLYLNPDWRAGDGGELLLYQGEHELARVAPCFARFAVFLSADFPHEVLPARRERLSVAGWFRPRPGGLA